MGLDMYLLNSEKEEIAYWRKANAIHGWFVRNCADGVDECQPIAVSREALNHLRNDVIVALAKKPQLVSAGSNNGIIAEGETSSPQDIMQFITDNMTVQAHEHEFNDEDDSDPLRPTRGFFFGSAEKDEWYYNDLEDTLVILNTALDSNETEFTYQASW